MAIAKLPFTEGLLEPGTHTLSLEDFIDTFCANRNLEPNSYVTRSEFAMPFWNIHKWASDAGATSMVIGGSFVSEKADPSDLDVLIFFARAELIPKSNEAFYVDGTTLDIQLLSDDQPKLADACLHLLATTRSEVPHGLIQIKFHSANRTIMRPDQPPDELEIVKSAYLNRRWSALRETKGVIVPIHGIRTHAEEWLPHLCLAASTSGWAVAPYVYGYREATILASNSEKKGVVEGFREWLIEVKRRYSGPVSLVAHSFGTYIIGRYLQDAKDIVAKFDGVIFCGSILKTSFDWTSLLESGIVGRVLNTVSEEDEWVRYIPEGFINYVKQDTLLGKAGREGFSQQHAHLFEIRSKLLQHNNIFKEDVVLGQWLPFLRIARGTQYIQERRFFGMRKHKNSLQDSSEKSR